MKFTPRLSVGLLLLSLSMLIHAHNPDRFSHDEVKDMNKIAFNKNKISSLLPTNEHIDENVVLITQEHLKGDFDSCYAIKSVKNNDTNHDRIRRCMASKIQCHLRDCSVGDKLTAKRVILMRAAYILCYYSPLRCKSNHPADCVVSHSIDMKKEGHSGDDQDKEGGWTNAVKKIRKFLTYNEKIYVDNLVLPCEVDDHTSRCLMHDDKCQKYEGTADQQEIIDRVRMEIPSKCSKWMPYNLEMLNCNQESKDGMK